MTGIKIKKSVVKQINKKLLESLANYKKITSLMAADIPIQALCLDKPIEKILLNNGFLRVYDILNMDLTKIKGLGKIRIRQLTARLNEFVFVS